MSFSEAASKGAVLRVDPGNVPAQINLQVLDQQEGRAPGTNRP